MNPRSFYSRYTTAPKAAAATAHRPPETVIDRPPALGFPDADALGLELAAVTPPVDWGLELSLEDFGDAVTVAWLLAGPVGVVEGTGAALAGGNINAGPLVAGPLLQ